MVRSSIVIRFGSIPDPEPSWLTRQSRLQRLLTSAWMLIPANRQRLANLHAQKIKTPWSPFISVASSIASVLDTQDAYLASIATGYETPENRAPFIFTYHIPETMLIRPEVGASQIEKELLYLGRKNISAYLMSDRTIENPYTPHHLTFERFRRTLGQ